MAIASSDIQIRLSGGNANTDPDAALGGTISSEAAGSDLFDDVSSSEALAGDTEYRCVYVRNGHASLTAQSTKVWIYTNTPSSSSDIAIGLGTSAVSATEQTVANEGTAPTGVTFSAAASEGAALSIGDLTTGQTKALWIRRTISAAAAAYAGDGFTLRVKCGTAP